MEINKQLFEDVLSGKLKGTFVFRNRLTCNSDELTRTIMDKYRAIYPYSIQTRTYAPSGRYNSSYEANVDIVDFIIDKNMEKNELTIEIPEGKTVDWEASQKQNKIIFKEDEKPLTYDDVCKKLFSDGGYFINAAGGICHSHNLKGLEYQFNNATTEHQLECIIAKNKLANIAVYLNDGWKPNEDSLSYYINNCHNKLVVYWCNDLNGISVRVGQIIFKSKELAEKAIKILGEETVKLALEPIGI